ncbi:hypothetical protein PPACK8108_LOCUS4389 [Phakopsora pachyrhizi]|uniref:Uncharacterized protein n=1 Tax=Phakopsora pachyrhizi TaxID=170000 RepID=A0AAV0ALV4_PHAPC|nr:hypothetical protein PPACK8108_LOCUS4389 [Phakopsora pachyrhizi]
MKCFEMIQFTNQEGESLGVEREQVQGPELPEGCCHFQAFHPAKGRAGSEFQDPELDQILNMGFEWALESYLLGPLAGFLGKPGPGRGVQTCFVWVGRIAEKAGIGGKMSRSSLGVSALNIVVEASLAAKTDHPHYFCCGDKGTEEGGELLVFGGGVMRIQWFRARETDRGNQKRGRGQPVGRLIPAPGDNVILELREELNSSLKKDRREKGRNRRRREVDIAGPTTAKSVVQQQDVDIAGPTTYLRADDTIAGPTKARMRFGGLKSLEEAGGRPEWEIDGKGKETEENFDLLTTITKALGSGKDSLGSEKRRSQRPTSRTVVGRAVGRDCRAGARRRHTEVRSSYHFRVRAKAGLGNTWEGSKYD